MPNRNTANSPMSPKKYDSTYRKNFSRIVKENKEKLGMSGPAPVNKKGQMSKAYERLVNQAIRETNKELGYTQAQAIRFQNSILKKKKK